MSNSTPPATAAIARADRSAGAPSGALSTSIGLSRTPGNAPSSSAFARQNAASPGVHLEGLDVPISHLIPEEIVNDAPAFAKIEFAQQAGHFGGHRRESTGDPAFGQWSVVPRNGRRQAAAALLWGSGRQHETADVPQLVHEVAPRTQHARRQREVV